MNSTSVAKGNSNVHKLCQLFIKCSWQSKERRTLIFIFAEKLYQPFAQCYKLVCDNFQTLHFEFFKYLHKSSCQISIGFVMSKFDTLWLKIAQCVRSMRCLKLPWQTQICVQVLIRIHQHVTQFIYIRQIRTRMPILAKSRNQRYETIDIGLFHI